MKEHVPSRAKVGNAHCDWKSRCKQQPHYLDAPPHEKDIETRSGSKNGGEGGIRTLANLRYPTLSAVTKSLCLNHLPGLRRIIKLAAAKNALKSCGATQQT